MPRLRAIPAMAMTLLVLIWSRAQELCLTVGGMTGIEVCRHTDREQNELFGQSGWQMTKVTSQAHFSRTAAKFVNIGLVAVRVSIASTFIMDKLTKTNLCLALSLTTALQTRSALS